MQIAYRPTALGPADVLDVADPASVGRARAFLRTLRFDMVVACDGCVCGTCKLAVPRGDIVRMRPMRAERDSSLAECRGCAAAEILPVSDALHGGAGQLERVALDALGALVATA